VRRRGIPNFALLAHAARYALQRFIGQLVGRGTILAVEILHQPVSNLEISLAAGVVSLIQPVQEPAKRVMLP